MASIQKRISKTGKTSFRVEVRLKGFPPQRATFERKTDAKDWAKNTESAIKEGRYFKTREAQKHTLADAIDKYIKSEVPKRKDEKKRKTHCNWWKTELGNYTLADVTPALISEARDRLLETKSPATTNRYLAALSHVLTITVKEWGWLEDSPIRKVTKPKEPRGRIRFLSEDEVIGGELVKGERTRLLEVCKGTDDDYLYMVVVLALTTGMRQGEILNLTWADVDLANGRITLLETKNGEIRVVPLVGHALELLKEHNKVRPIDTPLLFPGKRNHRIPASIRTPWEKAVKEAGIENFRFHDLRHSAASYLAMNGATLAEIAETLGHKTLQMVKRYSHLSEAHTAKVVSALNDRIFGGTE